MCCRGLAFPPQSIEFLDHLDLGILSPKLTTQGQFFCESIEGKAFADRGFCGEFKIVAQMLCPYGRNKSSNI